MDFCEISTAFFSGGANRFRALGDMGTLTVTSCTTQCLNGGFVKIGEITSRSVFIQRKREGNRGSRLLHSPSRQARDAIANLALGNRLKIIEVGRARVRKSVLLGEDDFCGNASDYG